MCKIQTTATDVAWFVFLWDCWTNLWSLQKRLNRLKCCWWWGFLRTTWTKH